MNLCVCINVRMQVYAQYTFALTTQVRHRVDIGACITCNQNAETGTLYVPSSFQTRRTVSVPPCIPTTAPDIIHSGS